MARWLLLTSLVTLHFLAGCHFSLAETSPALDELQTERAIAQADSALVTAQQKLACWKLTQLKMLESKGHASWQEVARQQVVVASATAEAKAARQFVQVLSDWQSRLSQLEHAPADTECIPLYLPGSPRLVAWIGAEVASADLVRTHLDNLRHQHRSASEIDLSSAESAIEAARKSVQAFSSRQRDAHLLRRAEIQLRIATAQFAGAQAHGEAAAILARRIALLGDPLQEHATRPDHELPPNGNSIELARAGTRFVDAGGDHELQTLVNEMVADDSVADAQLTWLLHQRDACSSRVSALQKLSAHALFEQRELEQAQHNLRELEQQIEQAQRVLRMRRQLADRYVPVRVSRPATFTEQSKPAQADSIAAADAGVIRHWLKLKRMDLQAAAGCAAVEAERDYLMERMRRVESIPESARAPREIEHLRHSIQGSQHRLDLFSGELVALDHERKRFVRQVQTQLGDQYQLVHSEQGKLLPREQFELAEAWIATVGLVGYGGLFPDRPRAYCYLESSTLLECLLENSPARRGLTVGLPGRNSWGSGIGSPVVARRSAAGPGVWGTRQLRYGNVWDSPFAVGRLTLPTDHFPYASELFSYAPFQFRHLHDDWRRLRDGRDAPADVGRIRFCYPYRSRDQGCGLGVGLRGQSVFSYRIGCPTRESFPYRSSYLYRTAFPTRSNLYTTRYARPSLPFSGLGYSSWLRSSCFD